MSSRPTPASRRRDATAQPSLKNVFDREPLLIPQRPEDRRRRWFRRRAVWAWAFLVVAVVVVVVVALGAGITRAFPGVVGR